MEQNVEELIKKGLKNLKKEKILHRKMIEANSNYDVQSFEEYQQEYKKYSQETKRIIKEICSQRELNVSKDDILKISTNLQKENNTEYDSITFFGLLLTEKFISQKTKYINPEKLFIQRNSIVCEYQVILYELLINYLRDNPDMEKEEKRILLDNFSSLTLGAIPIRKMFEGDNEIANLISTPELFLGNSTIKLTVKRQTEESLQQILNSLSTLMNTSLLLKIFSKKDISQYSELKPFFVPLKLKTAALCIQCEKYGISIDHSNLPTVDLEFLEDTKEIIDDYKKKKTKNLVQF